MPEHTRRDREVAGVRRKALVQVRVDGVESGVLQLVCTDFPGQADAPTLLAQVEQHAATFGGDGAEGTVELRSAVAAQGAEGITR